MGSKDLQNKTQNEANQPGEAGEHLKRRMHLYGVFVELQQEIHEKIQAGQIDPASDEFRRAAQHLVEVDWASERRRAARALDEIESKD